MISSIIDYQRANMMYEVLCDTTKDCLETIDQGKTGYCWLISAVDKILTDSGKENIIFNVNFQRLIYWDKFERVLKLLSEVFSCLLFCQYSEAREIIRNFKLSDEGQWSMAANIVDKHGIFIGNDFSQISNINTKELNAVLNYVIKGTAIEWLHLCGKNKMTPRDLDENQAYFLDGVSGILKKYLPNAFFDGQRIDDLSLDSYISVISSDLNFFSEEYAYRVVSENTITGGSPSVHYNISDSEFYDVVKEQIDRNKTVWITCDAGKFLLWNKGVFDDRIFDINQLPGVMINRTGLSRFEVKDAAIASMCHAMLIVGQFDESFIIKNTLGSGFGNKGYGIMSRSWFDKFVFQAVVSSTNNLEKLKERKVCDITAERFYRNV